MAASPSIFVVSAFPDLSAFSGKVKILLAVLCSRVIALSAPPNKDLSSVTCLYCLTYKLLLETRQIYEL
jgi:hypothetical protein